MKITKSQLREIIKEVITETDVHPNMLNHNKEVAHNWATHVSWKDSVHEQKYGKLGEVKHHTLFEDGTITNYDVQFENKLVKSIPADMLEVVNEKSHSHEVDTGEDEEEE